MRLSGTKNWILVLETIATTGYVTVPRPGLYEAKVKAKDGFWAPSTTWSNEIRLKFAPYKKLLRPTISAEIRGKNYLTAMIAVPFHGLTGIDEYELFFLKKEDNSRFRHHFRSNQQQPASVLVNVPGHYSVYIHALSTGWFAESEWSPPMEIVVDQYPKIFGRKFFFPGNVELSWPKYSNVDVYTLQISAFVQRNQLELKYERTGPDNQWTGHVQKPGRYRAKVIASTRLSGQKWTYIDFVVVTNLLAPVITRPSASHNSILLFEVAFEWTKVEFAPAYRLEISGPIYSDDDDSLNTDKKTYTYDTSATSQTVHTIRYPDAHRVRVAVLLQGNKVGPWSDYVKFNLQGVSENGYDPDNVREFSFRPVGRTWMKQKERDLGLVDLFDATTYRPDPMLDIRIRMTREPPDSDVKITYDGNCFFNLLSHELATIESHNKRLRERICKEEIGRDPTKYLPIASLSEAAAIAYTFVYLNNMTRPGTWATDVEIEAAAQFLKTPIWVYAKGDGTRYGWQKKGRICLTS